MTDPSHLLVDRQGPIVTVTLNRPDQRNALSLPLMLELTHVLQQIGSSDARGVILAANGPVFSAGHHFADMAGHSHDEVRELFRICTEMMDLLQALPQPVVARVHGLATAAGCQLVATCDLAVAAQSASFALPGGKGALFCHTPLVAVARNLGRKRALELAMTGDPIDASTALRVGIVSEVVPTGGALERATTIARRIASHPRGATRLARRAVLNAFELPLSEGVRGEQAAFRELASSDERQARMTAFLHRSDPPRT